MIARLRGELLELSGNLAVVDAGGVGYEVSIPDSVAVQFPPIGETVNLLTRQIFREDGISLYGFLTPFQRRLFDLLLEAKGCGPKVGLALIGQLGEDAVANAIATQDTKSLSRATGVGPRLAERIIVELKDKILQEQFQTRVANPVRSQEPARPSDDDVVAALLALGYRRPDAEAAAEKVRGTGSIEEQIRAALSAIRR